MNGSNSIIKVGTNDRDKNNGRDRDEFKFLKNSISSNKFKITPKAINIKIVLVIDFKKPSIKYLFIIVFIMIYVPYLYFRPKENKLQASKRKEIRNIL